MVESSALGQQLKAEKEWHVTAVFTDTKTVICQNNATLKPEEVE